MQSVDLIGTNAYGTSKDLACEKEEIKCNNITCPFGRFSTRVRQNARANTVRRAMMCDVYFPFSKIL